MKFLKGIYENPWLLLVPFLALIAHELLFVLGIIMWLTWLVCMVVAICWGIKEVFKAVIFYNRYKHDIPNRRRQAQ